MVVGIGHGHVPQGLAGRRMVPLAEGEGCLEADGGIRIVSELSDALGACVIIRMGCGEPCGVPADCVVIILQGMGDEGAGEFTQAVEGAERMEPSEGIGVLSGHLFERGCRGVIG
ncbi:MAG: hypothetical protein WD079_02360, partial [Phycisphaeraceae bacterium]